MSVLISGALINGAGVPMAECKIYLDALVNTSEVVTESFAVIETDAAGQYAFEAQKGKYTVHIKQKNGPKCCVGDISVYDDSKPGTLNDFLTALDEGDLKPDVVKRFEEMVAQAQQSAEAAAKSEQQAGKHVADAQQIKSDCETLADNVQQNAEAVAEDKKRVAQLASSATQDAARAEQAVKDADLIVQKAVDKLGEAATLTGEAKASAEAAAKSEQSAKQHRDEAQRIVDDLKGTNASTTQKGLVQLCSDTDNDSEELAATPKAVKAVMDETKTKAPLDSPAFIGTPTTPTPPDDATGLEMANAAFVRKLLAALVDSSPEALDTLNELAAALGNDPEFATTILNALAGKQPLSDVLTAISNLEERADNLLCFNHDGNASLSPLSEKARSLLAQATVEAMRNELELKSAAVRDIQIDLYDSMEGRVALPGAYGYGMTDAGARSIIASDMATVARTAHNLHPGRYYTFSTQTEKTTGITEIIWLDNGWDDKTSQTATKLVLFFGKDGRILMTVRGDNLSAPVTWTNLTPQLGNAAQKDAQESIYDRTEGRLAVPGMFGFGKIFSSGDRTEFKTEADFLRWVKTAKPGRYAVYADTNAVIQGVLFKGTVEIIWPEPQTNPNPAYVAKIIIFYGINGHIYYNRYWTTGDGYLVGWENLKVNEASLRALIETRAPLNSPALTGTPSTPTPPDDAAGNEIANAAFVRKLLAALVDSSPEALDTLNELAAALGNDPNFATTIMNALAGKQPLNDVLTAISELTQRADNLLCFNQDGNASLSPLSEKARLLLAQTTAEDMLSVLELQKNTYSAQSDIYDRAEDKLALPGAFGFGYPFGKEDQLTFKNTSELTTWVTNAYPGRYAVTVPNQGTIIPGVYFTGILDVIWQMNQYETKPPSDTAKCIMFYAGNGDIWFNRYIYGRLVGWERIKISTADIYNVMGGTISNEWGDPDVGGLIIAAYQGTTDGDTKIKLVRGQYYAGSRLGPVGISAPYNPAGTYSSSPQFYVMGNAGHSLPGTYRALSGVTNTYGSDAMIGLFIRTA
ncbi:prophage tail fiber N-terminal domain-containing protein [Escherichia coli]|uniref:prophage tail fiber N-terminal domain-containing protein n=3 Tax=Escherichia coli TaxID=562 RepID=UPI0019D1E1A3|nr:prophage tail fiber N-terminal domain-containing protein [Escherichia coli]MBN6421376.1 prophage tail fiber N-terminal domain-containing protein [Escherichia coli]